MHQFAACFQTHQLYAPAEDVCPLNVVRRVLRLVRQEPEGVRNHQAAVKLAL